MFWLFYVTVDIHSVLLCVECTHEDVCTAVHL